MLDIGKADIYVTVESDGRVWQLRPQTEPGEKHVGAKIGGIVRLSALESEGRCEEARKAGLVVRGDPMAEATLQ
jgi:hypothetical protein